jgi:hypothetical protein
MSFGLEITIMSRKGSSAALALLVALTVAGPAEAATWTYWSGSYYYYPSYSYYPAYSYYPTY